IRKVTNDAVAQIRSICDIRGRNQDLAEEMVRDSRSVEAKEAVELDAADIIADNLDTLIKLIDGWKVQLKSGAYMLETKDCEKIRINMNASEMILYTILEPNIAYILMIIGIMGLLMELSHPGAIFPGVIGGISLLMAFYAFQILPINYAGVLLILFGVILLILEIMITSYGILTIGGIASMLIGSFMLMSGAAPSLRISASVILPALLFLAAFFIFVITKAILAQGKKVTTGEKGLIGELGVASSNIDNEGFVLVHGEIWKARASMPIAKGTRVRVVGVDGMVVIVEPSLGDGKEEN
ncbi:MAG: NfeD family protein, partial [bacterium]